MHTAYVRIRTLTGGVLTTESQEFLTAGNKPAAIKKALAWLRCALDEAEMSTVRKASLTSETTLVEWSEM